MTTKINVVEIHRGVPIPDNYKRYPFDKLEVGDSFEFASNKRRSVSSRVHVLHKQSKRRYIVRKINDEVAGVWRVEDNEAA